MNFRFQYLQVAIAAALMLGAGACAADYGVEPPLPPETVLAPAQGAQGVRLLNLTPVSDTPREAELINPNSKINPNVNVHVFSPPTYYSQNVYIEHCMGLACFSLMMGSDGYNWAHYTSGPKASIYHTV